MKPIRWWKGRGVGLAYKIDLWWRKDAWERKATCYRGHRELGLAREFRREQATAMIAAYAALAEQMGLVYRPPCNSRRKRRGQIISRES